MDFNASYQSFIKRVFPNAKIIADRFHLIQMINRVTNQTRIKMMKDFEQDTRPYRLYKSHWKLFLMQYKDLEKDKVQWWPHLRDRLTQKQLVNEALGLNSEFEDTYNVCQDLVYAIKHNQTDIIYDIITTTKTNNPILKTLLKTFKKNYKSIVEATRMPYSNGRIEGVNRKIKQIGRTAYGFKNWFNYRARIYLEFKIKNKKRNPIRK